MKNFKSLLGISAFSLLFAGSALAAAGEDYSWGGTYGTATGDDYYSYDNWISNGWAESSFAELTETYYTASTDGETTSYTPVSSDDLVSGETYYTASEESGTTEYTAVTCETYYTKSVDGDYTALTYTEAASSTESLYTWTSEGATATIGTGTSYDNITIGAGATFTFNSGAVLTVSSNIYVYGNEEAAAMFYENTKSTSVTVNNMILDYGIFQQSAANTTTINNAIEMYNSSVFNVAAGTIEVYDFYISDDSILNVNGSTNGNKSTITSTGTLTLKDTAAVNVSNTNSASSDITLNNVIMQDYATYTMSMGGVLTVEGAFTMTGDSVFSKTAGTLTFDSTKITIRDNASFSTNSVTFSDDASISLVVASLSDSTATIEGSINLGTVTLGTSILSLYLDVSDVEDSLSDGLTFALSDFITITNESVLGDNFAVALTDAEGTVSEDYSASFTYDAYGSYISFSYIGAAVPEPSTYAMILGAFALGFAYYRRRK